MILALDPSSTKVGYCLARPQPFRVSEHGLITPDKARADAQVRAESIARQVAETIRETRLSHVVIETPGKRPPRDIRINAGGYGQAHYGYAVGYLVGALLPLCTVRRVELVRAPADEWTSTAKKKRAVAVMQLCPSYDPKKDKTLDMADAIELAHWFVNHKLAAAGGRS